MTHTRVVTFLSVAYSAFACRLRVAVAGQEVFRGASHRVLLHDLASACWGLMMRSISHPGCKVDTAHHQRPVHACMNHAPGMAQPWLGELGADLNLHRLVSECFALLQEATVAACCLRQTALRIPFSTAAGWHLLPCAL